MSDTPAHPDCCRCCECYGLLVARIRAIAADSEIYAAHLTELAEQEALTAPVGTRSLEAARLARDAQRAQRMATKARAGLALRGLS